MPGEFSLAHSRSRSSQRNFECRGKPRARVRVRCTLIAAHPLRNCFFLPSTENQMRFLAIGFCAFAMLPAASNGQQLSQNPGKGPTLQAAAVGFRPHELKVDASSKVTMAAPRPRAGQDVALMVVGVGTMIVGALVGDDAGTIIIIGGAAMALYGLYHYLE